MNIHEAKELRIVEYLAFLGYKPTKVARGQYWYISPFRAEKTASFKVNDYINEWYDFGIAEGGDIIDLCKRLFHTESISAVLTSLSKNLPASSAMKIRTRMPPSIDMERQMSNLVISPLHNIALLSYIKSRFINIEVAQDFCKEIYYSIGKRKYFAIVFENRSGGYEVRNAYYKGCIKRKDITLINRGQSIKHDHVCIFEGFMDFLSYETLFKSHNLQICLTVSADCLIMNSVANLRKCFEVLDRYSIIHCYLDNDLAGQRTTEAFRSKYGVRVRDESVRYQDYKDLNDYLKGKCI